MSLGAWESVVDIILKGSFLCSRAVLPGMMARQSGRIVNISSRSIFGNPGQANYSAAKAGLIGFTRALSLEAGKFGITVNAVAPGFIMTEGIQSLPHFEKLRDAAVAKNPVGFLGSRATCRTRCCSSPPTPPATSRARRSSSPAGATRRELRLQPRAGTATR